MLLDTPACGEEEERGGDGAMDESGGGQDCDPGQDFCEERWRRVNKGKERMDNQ